MPQRPVPSHSLHASVSDVHVMSHRHSRHRVLQEVLCNDCEKRSQAPFHFVYHCCEHCQSYNTRLV